jgi:hypothetical protein
MKGEKEKINIYLLHHFVSGVVPSSALRNGIRNCSNTVLYAYLPFYGFEVSFEGG